MNDKDDKSSQVDIAIARKKVANFEKELEALQRKHGIMVVPVIQAPMVGPGLVGSLTPQLMYLDEQQFKQRTGRNFPWNEGDGEGKDRILGSRPS